MQVAEEIGTEARFQKDFLNQLVNHLHLHTQMYISYDLWPALGSYCQDILNFIGGTTILFKLNLELSMMNLLVKISLRKSSQLIFYV